MLRVECTMAPRGTRRQPTTDDYSDESDMSSSKRKKKEPVEEPKDSQHVAIGRFRLAVDYAQTKRSLRMRLRY